MKKKDEKKEDEGTKGVGEVQYFTYPEKKELEGGEEKEHIDALNQLENKIVQSAEKQQMSGGNTMGYFDASEQNF